MTTYDKAVELILKHEGGYVDHPNDPGGETNMGISKRSYPDEDIKGMTKERAKEIYKKDFWDAVKGDQLPAAVALICFDTAVMSGSRRACRFLQKACGVTTDGIVGPMTLGAVRVDYRISEEDFLDELSNTRLNFYKRLKTFGTFGRGWTNRVNNTNEEAKGWISKS
jgi:lysozyme family protein